MTLYESFHGGAPLAGEVVETFNLPKGNAVMNHFGCGSAALWNI
jgi:hypothetical protein